MDERSLKDIVFGALLLLSLLSCWNLSQETYHSPSIAIGFVASFLGASVGFVGLFTCYLTGDRDD